MVPVRPAKYVVASNRVDGKQEFECPVSICMDVCMQCMFGNSKEAIANPERAPIAKEFENLQDSIRKKGAKGKKKYVVS